MALPEVMVAGPEHDAQIRQLLRETPSEGHMQLRSQKEPSYFEALQVEGIRSDVVIGRDAATGRAVGVGTRSEKPCYINGAAEPRNLGYLSNLRILPSYRRGTGLWRAFGKMRALHHAGSAKLYLTTIMEDNAEARQILTSGRAGLPTYRDWGTYRTFVIAATRNPWPRPSKASPIRVRRAREADIPAVIAFLHRHGCRRQFFPAYTAEDISRPSGLLRGLEAHDIFLAEVGDELCGTTALWDQSRFRQWIVHGYTGRLAATRRLYNVFAHLTGRPRLPPAGRTLDYRFMSLVCTQRDRCDVARALWHEVFADVARLSRDGLVVLGLHERDPLVALTQGVPCYELRSRLYVVHWADGAAACDDLDPSLWPYVEVGSL